MIRSPLLRRATASLLACALLASCSAPEDDTKAGSQSGADASAAKVGAPEAQGGRATQDVAFLATVRPLHCPGAGFFPQDTVVVTATGGWQNAPVPGGHFLRFDSAAVPAGTQFTVTRAYADTAALDVRPTAPPVAYSGLVGLTISYASCAGADSTGYGLFRQDSTLRLQGRANRNRSVTAELDHFSIYIVGGN